MTPLRRSRFAYGWKATPSTRIPSRTGFFSGFSGRILSWTVSTDRKVVAKTRSPGRTRWERCQRSSTLSAKSLTSPWDPRNSRNSAFTRHTPG
jgi:hypothetical protein